MNKEAFHSKGRHAERSRSISTGSLEWHHNVSTRDASLRSA